MSNNDKILLIINRLNRLTSEFSNKTLSLSEENRSTLFNYLIKDILSLRLVFRLEPIHDDEYVILIALYFEISEKAGLIKKSDSILLASKWPITNREIKERWFAICKNIEEIPGYFHSLKYLRDLDVVEIQSQTTNYLLDIIKEISGLNKFDLEKRELINSWVIRLVENSNLNNKLIVENEIKKLLNQSNLTFEDGKIKIPLVSDIKSIISINERLFFDFEPNSIKHFVYSIKYLTELSNEISSTELKMLNCNNNEVLVFWFELTFSQIRTYNYLYSILLKQINAIFKNLQIEYFECYTVLDEIGVYQTGSDKNTARILEQISNNQITISERLKTISTQLEILTNKIDFLNENVTNVAKSIFSLEQTMKNGYYNLSYKLNQIDNNIQFGYEFLDNSLKEINSSLRYTNLISSVNAYQTYRLNTQIGTLLD